ncbi:hypothetical protein EON62_02730 [archaeon]|nr:MAG: hypothetical protein EON62_02730 [archaeon]
MPSAVSPGGSIGAFAGGTVRRPARLSAGSYSRRGGGGGGVGGADAASPTMAHPLDVSADSLCAFLSSQQAAGTSRVSPAAVPMHSTDESVWHTLHAAGERGSEAGIVGGIAAAAAAAQKRCVVTGGGGSVAPLTSLLAQRGESALRSPERAMAGVNRR